MNANADPTREAIRRELEETRRAYHELLTAVPEQAYELPTANPSWNVREVLYHITLAHKNLPYDLKMLRSPITFNPPKLFLNLFKAVFDRVNDWYTRWGARNQNRETLAAEFDKQHHNILRLLDTIRPDEWRESGTYPDINENLAGEQTVADMFHYLTVHFWEHEAEIMAAVGQ